jgi:hypothetical protein
MAYLSTVVTSPVPAAQYIGVGLRPPFLGQPFGRRRTTRQMCGGTKYI